MLHHFARKGLSAILLTALFALAIVPAAAQETVCEDGFRLFDHEYLATDPVCIPDNPQRVATFDLNALELLFFTDKEIVVASEWVLDELAASVPALHERLALIPNAGYPANAEDVLAASPDIILMYQAGDEAENYESYAAIAPAVMTTLSVQDWDLTAQFWSEVLGVPEVYEEMVATYDARIAELQAALPEGYEETEVSLVTAMSYGMLTWLSNSPQGKILADVGFARPESQSLTEEEAAELGRTYWKILSKETLNLVDGDVIYLFSYATTDEEVAAAESAVIEALQQDPLWLNLAGVQAGNAFVMPGYWYRGSTYLFSNLIIDDLFASLTDAEATTPNPISLFETVEE